MLKIFRLFRLGVFLHFYAAVRDFALIGIWNLVNVIVLIDDFESVNFHIHSKN